MEDFSLPFPGRELADAELSYDLCYRRIAVSDRGRITEAAWQKGVQAAKMVFERTGGEYDFFAIAKQSGLTCVHIDKDYISGNQRYFSDYISGQSLINLYTKSIAIWAAENKLTQEQAENLILSHEYFHFLEWTELGLTSRDYQVPMLTVLGIKIGKTGIRALSEIGAHAFARTYYDLQKEASKHE
ncbi:MAG: hypothetical protein RSF82_04095 [Angelakisella sp.]